MSPEKGFKHSPEAIAKMRLAKLGKKNPMFGTSGGMFGKKHSTEAKEKMSLSHMGGLGYWQDKKFSDEHKKKIGLAHKGKKLTPEHVAKLRQATIERIKKHKDKYLMGSNNPNWRGGRSIYKYVYIRQPNHPRASISGMVPEHRLVWEEYWGQIVPRGYIVHHINGDTLNNHISNLVMMTQNQHAKIHSNNTQRDSKGKFFSHQI